MNTQENNKLIAEFMGLQLEQEQDRIFIKGLGTKLIEETFNTDWNWLMEVVCKIESIVWEDLNDTSFNVTIGATSYCVIQDNNGGLVEIIGQGSTKIESVYNAVVLFIKWYNEQK